MSRPIANERQHWPCGDYPDGKCPKRQPGCQDRCPEMLAAQLEHDARMKAEKTARATEIGTAASNINRVNRNARKKSRQI